MKHSRLLAAIFVLLLTGSCSSSRVITAWKNEKSESRHYGRVLVVGITGEGNDSLRLVTERYFMTELQTLGYQAISAFETFGPHGLAAMTDEETYIHLCNKGIDAVITIALVDRTKETAYLPRRSYGYPNNYYYQRMKNYKNIQPDSNAAAAKSAYCWESILFDLQTLEAIGTVQTPVSTRINTEKLAREFEKKIIRRMKKEKILTIQPVAPRAF